MKKDRYDSLEQLLAEQLGEFREEPSEGLFDRIEATLLEVSAAPVVAKKVPLWRRPAMRIALATAVAASVLFGVVVFIDRTTTESEMEPLNEVVVAQVQTTPTVEIDWEGIKTEGLAQSVSVPKRRMVVAKVSEQQMTQTIAEPTAEAEQGATKQSVEERPKRKTTATTTKRQRQPRKSDEEIEAYWRAVLGLDEEPRRLGLTHPTEISLYAANMGFNQGDITHRNIANGSMMVNEHSLLSGESGLTSPNVFRAPQKHNTLKHYMPVSVGLAASYAITDWMALETGLVYTHLHSRSDNEGQQSNYTCKRDMHYLGLPLGATFRFANWDRFGLYGRLGTTLEHCISAKDTYFMNSKKDTFAKLDTHGLQLSLDAAAGANYMLWGGVGLYAEAGVSYWTSLAPHPDNYRTENPLSLTCRFGLRFTFR